MSAVTNNAINTATPTNNALSATSLKWSEALYIWAQGSGIWSNPYKLVNNAINTATITNNA